MNFLMQIDRCASYTTAALHIRLPDPAAVGVDHVISSIRSSSHGPHDFMVYQRQLEFPTTGNGDLHDLTADVAQIVAASGVGCGVAHVFNVGSTASVTTIEFEPGLCEDLPSLLNRLIPPGRDYGHERAWHDGNAHSHLQATWLGPSESLPIADGQLVLGTWQQIVHLECDNKPRQRKVLVTVYGE